MYRRRKYLFPGVGKSSPLFSVEYLLALRITNINEMTKRQSDKWKLNQRLQVARVFIGWAIVARKSCSAYVNPEVRDRGSGRIWLVERIESEQSINLSCAFHGRVCQVAFQRLTRSIWRREGRENSRMWLAGGSTDCAVYRIKLSNTP